jgi:hypothetical protein
MRPRLITAAMTAFFVATPVAYADDDQTWLAVNAAGPIEKGSPLLVWVDMHHRSFSASGEREVTIFRPGLGYRVSPTLDLWVGYAWVTTARDGRDVREERFWQQATYPLGEFIGGQLSGRTRLEQRTRDGSDEVGVRLRQQLRYAYRFEESPFGLVAWNEIFLGLNETTWGQPSGFDQNRLFAGVSFSPANNLRLEAGYLNQFVDGSSADIERDNLQVSATYSF